MKKFSITIYPSESCAAFHLLHAGTASTLSYRILTDVSLYENTCESYYFCCFCLHLTYNRADQNSAQHSQPHFSVCVCEGGWAWMHMFFPSVCPVSHSLSTNEYWWNTGGALMELHFNDVCCFYDGN